MTDWPVALSGVTESVTTTLGPNDRWNVAALGIIAPDERPTDGRADDGRATDEPANDGRANDAATARTWGRTRTLRNFRERGEGYVQFTPDPVDFVEAACGVREADDPLLDSADAWARVRVERLDGGEEAGTGWVDWALRPVEAGIERERPFAPNRGYYAVLEATVAASRLDVPAYDDATLRERIGYFESVVEACGGERERAAWARFEELVDARP